MSEPREDYLAAAKDGIKSGNTYANLILIGIVVWGLTNIIPFDLSGTKDGSGRYRVTRLVELAQACESACSSVRDRFVQFQSRLILGVTTGKIRRNERRFSDQVDQQPAAAASMNGSDLQLSRLSLIEAAGIDLKPALENIEIGLDDLEDLRRAGKSQDAHEYNEIKYRLKACNKQSEELKKFTSETIRGGSLEVAGFKVGSLNPKYYALGFAALMLILTYALGEKRRQIFRLVDRVRDSESNNIAASLPLLHTISWWLVPLPHWVRRPSAPDPLCAAADYKAAIYRAAVIWIGLSVMFAAALYYQKYIVYLQLSPLQRDLAGLKHELSFSFTGLPMLDLSALGMLIVFGIALFSWNVAPHAPESENDDGGRQS